MLEFTNSLIGTIGQLNRACREADVSWQILKYPTESSYTALLCSISENQGPDVIKEDFIDSLIERMVEQAEIIARSH